MFTAVTLKKRTLRENNLRIKVYLFFSIIIAFSANHLPANEGWWSVYFTSPGKVQESTKQPEDALISEIDRTKTEINGAFFDISSKRIADAFLRAKARGVIVRLVTDNMHYSNSQVSRLISGGIQVITDNRRAFMHNKFAVFDANAVWTGSMNITDNGVRLNNNNSLLIKSSALASIYNSEFREMFSERVFGNRRETGILPSLGNRYHVKIGDTNINAYFSPENNIEDIIVKRIRGAKKSIHFMAFSFTSGRIGEEMIKAARRGVKVVGLFEKRGAGSKYSQFTKMKVEGISVKKDTNPRAMHHKVIIIDGERLITGSYNFSKNAAKKNDENVLMIDNISICGEYIKEFYRLYR